MSSRPKPVNREYLETIDANLNDLAAMPPSPAKAMAFRFIGSMVSAARDELAWVQQDQTSWEYEEQPSEFRD